jgi:hypothetical protein
VFIVKSPSAVLTAVTISITRIRLKSKAILMEIDGWLSAGDGQSAWRSVPFNGALGVKIRSQAA